jgi:hypothetical protein
VTDWQFTRVWRRALLPAVNRLMRAWLRSGWHRPVSSTMMVLTFEGVRSGRTYSFPVGYAQDPEGLVSFTRFSWWKNFREERPVSLRLRGREARGTAVAVRDPEAVAERLAYYLRRNPHDGKYFGVRVGRDGRADPGELAHASGRLLMIRSRPKEVHTPIAASCGQCRKAVATLGTVLVPTLGRPRDAEPRFLPPACPDPSGASGRRVLPGSRRNPLLVA